MMTVREVPLEVERRSGSPAPLSGESGLVARSEAEPSEDRAGLAGTERSELAGLIEYALSTRRERARTILDRCMEKTPHYRHLPSSVLEDVFQSTIYHQTIFYKVTLEQGRPMSAEELEPGRQGARSRARLGVPLGEYLLFFQEGLRIIVEDLVNSAGGDEARGELLNRLPVIISNQTQLMTALTEAYVEERERRSHFRDQDLYDFFELLLHEQGSESVVDVRARALGISLSGEHTVVLFRSTVSAGAAAGTSGLEDLRRDLASSIGEAPGWVGRSREGFVALVSGDPDPAKLGHVVTQLLGEGGRIGIGRPGVGVAGARRSAQEALRAVRIGSMLHRERPVYRYADVEILDLVGIGSPAAEEFMRRVLGPLARPDASRTHVETLRALAENEFTIKPAAAALQVHPHTLSYRIKQIRTRHGIDLDEAGVRLRVQLALNILDAITLDT